jgi:hypothetical protein
MERCYFCGQLATMVWVHGHYQCSHCRQITVPCCNGETAVNIVASTGVDADARRTRSGASNR